MNTEQEPQTFVVDFPFHIPVFPPFRFDDLTHKITVESARNFMVANAEGQLRVPTFTDDDLAARFIASQNKCGMMLLVKIETMPDLIRLLETVEMIQPGMGCILIDPVPKAPQMVVTREQLVEISS